MSSQYIAESYISFEDIEVTPLGEQIMMNLSRPEYTGMFSRRGKFKTPNKNYLFSDSESLRALEYRLGDKQAKDFLKKLKNRSFS